MTTTSSTKQQTLAAPLTFSGKGLHTGVQVTMTVNPAPKDHGIVFRRPPLNHPDFSHHTAAGRRCTMNSDHIPPQSPACRKVCSSSEIAASSSVPSAVTRISSPHFTPSCIRENSFLQSADFHSIPLLFYVRNQVYL